MDIIGCAKQVWFSYEAKTGVRWDRFGKLF
jgi:hypothetical protein